MRVVVTGATGFIGSRVVAYLKMSGHEVVPVARRVGAIDGCSVVADYAESPVGDALVHLAQDSDRQRVNGAGESAVQSSLEQLNKLLSKGYSRVVYVSSAILYGDQGETPRKVTDQVYETDVYSRMKRQCELVVLNSGVGVVARLGNIYGSGMSASNVLSAILAQIPAAGDIHVMDDMPERDFLEVEDAAQALSMMVTGGAPGLFNVGSGVRTSVNMLAQICLELAGEGHRNIVATQRSNRRSSLVLDVGETEAAFGWRPGVALADGLKCLVSERMSRT